MKKKSLYRTLLETAYQDEHLLKEQDGGYKEKREMLIKKLRPILEELEKESKVAFELFNDFIDDDGNLRGGIQHRFDKAIPSLEDIIDMLEHPEKYEY